MADLILKVTPQEVIDKASAISTKRSQMEQLMNDMEGLAKSLAESWASTSGDQYVEKYMHVKKETNNSLMNLQTHVDHLNAAAKEYSRVEQDNMKDVNALSTNNIS